jgi:hypothetical protein
MYLRLLYFSTTSIKIPDGYQIASFEDFKLVINQSVVHVE